MTPGNAEKCVGDVTTDGTEPGGLVVDLFAGPGGWDVAARELGLDAVGIELDGAACATREVAGLRTVQADVAALPLYDTDVWGLIASPPCQTFSAAGKGAGRQALDDVLLGVDLVARGLPICEFDDVRTALVLQPLRWALHYRPEWIAWEQVPPVLPVWEACSEVLRGGGYSVATGRITSEQYGVPQTRRRSILVASRVREVTLPEPTHRKYRKGVAQHEGDESLRPWLSMAEALGWGMTEAVAVMVSNYGTGGDPANRGERTEDEPSATVTGKIDRNKWELRNNTSANAAIRQEDEPSPTLYFGARANGVYWQASRPSTTVNCDPRISAPGRHDPNVSGSQQKGATRVTVQEAGILQSFPADYPWQGTKTKQYQQVGNAIPPLMALHVLAAATGLALDLPDTNEDAA